MDYKLRALYREWRAEQPESIFGRQATCCYQSHFVTKPFSRQSIPLDDDLVCDRERAWRRYVRARDNNPGFMTHLTIIK